MLMNRSQRLASAAILLVSCAAQAGDAQVETVIVRHQGALGLTDSYATASVSGLRFNAVGSIMNAAGSAWQIDTGPNYGYCSSSLGPPIQNLSEAYVDAWTSNLGRGIWSADFGNGSFQFDTTPYYRAAAQRSYLTLTAASVAQWNSIVSSGATGLFTFELTQSPSALGFAVAQAFSTLGTSADLVQLDLNSTMFTLSVTQQVSDPSFGLLFVEGFSQRETLYSANGDSMTYQEGASTVTSGAVPAPGAIALLGLAGLAGRRRR